MDNWKDSAHKLHNPLFNYLKLEANAFEPHSNRVEINPQNNNSMK